METIVGISANEKIKFWLKVFSGPLCFLVVKSLPLQGLASEGKFVLALYLWIIAWWVTQPLPWGVTSLLPLIVLPAAGLMKLGDVSSLYGQKLLFFIIGVLLFGHAVQKHGLGKRIALYFLSLKWVGGSINRIMFAFLCSIAVLSAFIDDAATVALGIPIAMSIVDFIIATTKQARITTLKEQKLQAFAALGVLYAAEAGGIMTVAGIPHIATAISVMEKTVNKTISFVEWSQTGIFLGIFTLIAYWFVLKLFFNPELKNIPDVNGYFQKEKAKLGRLKKGEINTLIVFVVMLALWIAPLFIKLDFIEIWFAPIMGAVLLYLLPADNEGKKGTLEAKDLQDGLPWNIIFLILCGSVMASATTEFGVIKWIQSGIPTNLNPAVLPFLAGFTTAGVSNFISGVATVNIMGNILFPVASKIGLDPQILVRILPATGMAIMLPWAGAATGTAFSTGKIRINDMIKCGFAASIIHIIAVTILSCVLVPLFY